MVRTAGKSMKQDELSDTPIQSTVYSGDNIVQGLTACEPSPPKALQYGKVTLLLPKHKLSTAEQPGLTSSFSVNAHYQNWWEFS